MRIIYLKEKCIYKPLFCPCHKTLQILIEERLFDFFEGDNPLDA